MSTRPCPIAVGGDPNLNQTSAHGGVVLWLELLRRTGVLHGLPVQVAGHQGWTDGQMMLAVALLNVVGYERVSDVGALEEDASLCRLVRDYEEELLGLPSDVLARRFRGGRAPPFPRPTPCTTGGVASRTRPRGSPGRRGRRGCRSRRPSFR